MVPNSFYSLRTRHRVLLGLIYCTHNTALQHTQLRSTKKGAGAQSALGDLHASRDAVLALRAAPNATDGTTKCI